MNDQDSYWRGRWERGETGWHQDEVEPELIENFSGVAPTRVLVPLCGKSLDLSWLATQGHEVIGVELCEKACRAFFEEGKMSPVITEVSPFRVYRSGKITLYCGNFFEITPAQLGSIGAVYDRAALIALPPDLRVKYVAHMTALLKECALTDGFHFLQLVWEKVPHDIQGPPFSVTPELLKQYYQKDFDLRLIKREEIDSPSAERKIFQSSYQISRRTTQSR